ncbi:hypothetical protein K3495_g9505 [Podosphaera aphanis]|nr:hypothetical protein K3495_g9505 [Podosphaera aphanis]
MTAPEINDTVGDKNLLAIVEVLKEFRQWALKLAELEFSAEFRPRIRNSRADALTRRSEDLVGQQETPHDLIIPPHKIIESNLTETEKSMTLYSSSSTRNDGPIVDFEPSLIKELKDSLDSDVLGQSIIKAITSSSPRHPQVDLGSC